MTAEKRRAENAAAAEGRRGLHGAVDEIVESVLDAADLDILEALGEERGERELGPELLRALMLDVLGRYWTRRRRSAAIPSAGEEAA
jgi:hypothetical protein